MTSRFAQIQGTPEQVEKFLKDIGQPLDDLVMRVMLALEMYPDNVQFGIVLNAKSFYAYTRANAIVVPMKQWYEKSMYVVKVAHEIAHIIIEHSHPGMSYDCHEALAQMAHVKFRRGIV